MSKPIVPAPIVVFHPDYPPTQVRHLRQELAEQDRPRAWIIRKVGLFTARTTLILPRWNA